MEDIADERGFSGTRYAGDRAENPQRKFNIEVFDVVVGHPAKFDMFIRFAAAFGNWNDLAAFEVVGGQ